MGTLRLLEAGTPPERHEGEIYSCAYAADGAFLLSAGWDGQLRLWDAETGQSLTSLPASPRPLSSCAFSPDGRQWLSGSMEGLLTIWDGVSCQSLLNFVAHTRPISSIAFAPDGQSLVTASWDKVIALRKVGKEREGRNLNGHADIVAGACFSVDGSHIVSWSYDGTIKIWDPVLARDVVTLTGHTDRVTTAGLSPDGRWLVSGGRDGLARLWDLESKVEVSALNVGAEVRGCYFLPDAESVVVCDAVGRVFLFDAPVFQVQSQLQTPFRVMSSALSPDGTQLALGCEDGLLHFVRVEGYENSSLVVTAVSSVKEQTTILGRMFGSTKVAKVFTFTCPACRQAVESPSLPARPIACPKCRRQLKVNGRMPAMST